jgi:hypothetical protein
MKERHVDSLQGWVVFSRQRYYCRKCRKGYYPIEQALKLSNQSRMSEQKEKQLVLLSVRLPYEEARKVYEELTGYSVGRMTAHRSVQRVGQKICGKVSQAKGFKALKKTEGQKHITADGTMIHIRGEGWKEAKVGARYETDCKRRAREIIYTGTLGCREQLGKQLYDLCGKPELEQTREMAFVADAAEWLENIQQFHFPKATMIVDFWHAAEYVWKVARRFYGEESLKTRKWAQGKVHQLRKGSWKSVIRALYHLQPKTPEQTEILENTIRYFHNHGRKMNYPLYERKGFHIGSGIAEGACKYVIQSRFKQAGMRWSRVGAENLLWLRICYLNQGDIQIPEVSLN